MSVPKKNIKKSIRFATSLCPVLSLYFAGSLKSVSTELGHTWNPFRVLKCVVTYGFPTELFFLFLCIFGGLAGYAIYRQMHPEENEDAMGRNFKYSEGWQSYGQAHFEKPYEYEKRATIESPDTAMGMILGQLDDSGERLITQRLDYKNRGNRHVAVIGSTGSGKTYTLVKSTCFQVVRRRESIIITDPDGGLFRDMSCYFRDNGYVVRHLDVNDIQHSDGWDCLKSINSVDDAQKFANVIVSNVSGGTNSIYESGPKALLAALILRVILDPDRPQEEKNLRAVFEMLQLPGGEKDLDMIFDEETMPAELKPCLPSYRIFKQGSPNLRGNLIANLGLDLQLLQDDSISKILSTDDIDLLLPAEQPCAYFCGFPDSHKTYKFILSLFFSMIFIRQIHYADVVKHGKLPVPVNFLLDEFPSIGQLPDWESKMATIRKRNMNVTMIYQDIMLFRNVYPDTWGSILGSCSTMIILGINEDQSAELMSKRIGDTTIEARTQQHSTVQSAIGNFFDGNKSSTGEGRRPLVAYDEIFKMDEDNAIVLLQNHDAILCRKYPHVLHPAAKELRQVSYDEIPTLDDDEGRARVRAEENARVAAYLEEHPLSEVDRTYESIYSRKGHNEGDFIDWQRIKETFGRIRAAVRSLAHDEWADWEIAEGDIEVPENDVSSTDAACEMSFDEGDIFCVTAPDLSAETDDSQIDDDDQMDDDDTVSIELEEEGLKMHRDSEESEHQIVPDELRVSSPVKRDTTPQTAPDEQKVESVPKDTQATDERSRGEALIETSREQKTAGAGAGIRPQGKPMPHKRYGKNAPSVGNALPMFANDAMVVSEAKKESKFHPSKRKNGTKEGR